MTHVSRHARADRRVRRPASSTTSGANALVDLQRSAGNRAVSRLVAGRAPVTSSDGAIVVQRDDDEVRESTLDAMTADMTLVDGQRARLLTALGAFSVGQLRQMRRAGLRFWGPTGVPGSLEGSMDFPELPSGSSGGTRASYIPTARVVRVRGGSPVGHIVHELAHAWDNVRSGSMRSVDSMLRARDPAAAIGAEHRRTGARMWTDAETRHRTRDATGTRVRMTIAEMLEAYRGRPVLREDRFGTTGTREGYSMRSPQEFYAEGYAVFHVGTADQKAAFELQAPELFHLIEREAR